MKRTLQNEYKYDKYDKIDMLWKKISKVPKPPIQRTDTLPTERFETSLELELLNEQKILKNSNKELKQKNAWKIRYQKQIQRREDQEDEKKKSFQDSLIKLSVSTYNIEATQQSNKYLKDQTCKPCLQRFQQIIRKLKQQIKLFLLDYKIFQQHIKLEIKSYWHEVQQLSNKMHSGSTTTQTKLDEQVLKMKLEQKKSVQDKLYYIEKENIVRKKSIIKLEQELLKAKEQSQLLQRSYFNLKISNLIQIPKSFYKQSSDNEFESKNLSAQKSEKLRFSQKGRNEDRVGQNKKQEENEQIQSIKKKLNGLKIRLNKTYSNIN